LRSKLLRLFRFLRLREFVETWKVDHGKIRFATTEEADKGGARQYNNE
jgi:hypothetical protein